MPTRKRLNSPSRARQHGVALWSGASHLPPAIQSALRALTVPKQKFVARYCGEANGNGTLAAKLSGLGGHSYAAQASSATMALQDTKVRHAIEVWMQTFAMSSVDLTAKITDLAHANMGPFTTWNTDGTISIKTPDEATWEAHKHWIKEIETDSKGKVIRVQLHDSLRASDLLAKILKLYSDQPMVALHLHLQQLTDQQILDEIAKAREEELNGADNMVALPAGPPIAVVEKKDAP